MASCPWNFAFFHSPAPLGDFPKKEFVFPLFLIYSPLRSLHLPLGEMLSFSIPIFFTRIPILLYTSTIKEGSCIDRGFTISSSHLFFLPRPCSFVKRALCPRITKAPLWALWIISTRNPLTPMPHIRWSGPRFDLAGSPCPVTLPPLSLPK